MAAGRERMQRGTDEVGRGPRGCDRDGIVLAMENDRGDPAESGKLKAEIVIAETGPDFLLSAAGDPKGSQVAGPLGIVEVGRDRELEDALLEGGGVTLAKSALPQAAALLLEDGIQVALVEPGLVALPGRAPGRRRRHQGKPLNPLGVLQGVEQG